MEEDDRRHLTREAGEDLEADGEEVACRDETTWRSLLHQRVPGPRPTHEDGHGGGDDQIYVEELSVAKVGVESVEDQH